MDRLTVNAHELFRFVSEDVHANMYILLSGVRALVVDPHPAPRALALLQEAGIAECSLLLTHEHPDHTGGVYGFQQLFRSELICHEACARAIAVPDENYPALIVAMLAVQDERNGTNTAEHFRRNYQERLYQADVTFAERLEWTWEQEQFCLVSTPGHSAGSCCILWNDAAVFTGDSLLKDIPAITRLPGGSTKCYKTDTLPFLASLSRDLVVLPGHGPEFRLGDTALWSDYVEPVDI